MSGLSVAVSWDPQDTDANDRLLRRVKAELPPYVANLLLFALDGTNIGTSSDAGRFSAGDRDYFQQILAGQHASPSARSFARAPARNGSSPSRVRSSTTTASCARCSPSARGSSTSRTR